MSEARKEEAVAYLLGELDPEAAAAFERRLEIDPQLRIDLERVGGVVAKLETVPVEAWEAEELPPLALPVDAPTPRAQARRGWSFRDWFTLRRTAFAGAFAVAIFAGGILLGTALDGAGTDETPVTQSVDLRPLAPETRGGGLVTLEQDDRGTAELIVDGLPENRDNSFYEAWLLGPQGVVSLGSFRVDGEGHADTPITIPVDPGEYESFDISLEHDDGDPSHSGESLLRGRVAASAAI